MDFANLQTTSTVTLSLPLSHKRTVQRETWDKKSWLGWSRSALLGSLESPRGKQGNKQQQQNPGLAKLVVWSLWFEWKKQMWKREEKIVGRASWISTSGGGCTWMTKGNPNREVILGNFRRGGERVGGGAAWNTSRYPPDCRFLPCEEKCKFEKRPHQEPGYTDCAFIRSSKRGLQAARSCLLCFVWKPKNPWSPAWESGQVSQFTVVEEADGEGGSAFPKVCFSPLSKLHWKSIFQKYENWHQPNAAFGVYGGGLWSVVGVVGKHSGNTFLEIIPYWPEPQLWQLLGIPPNNGTWLFGPDRSWTSS